MFQKAVCVGVGLVQLACACCSLMSDVSTHGAFDSVRTLELVGLRAVYGVLYILEPFIAASHGGGQVFVRCAFHFVGAGAALFEVLFGVSIAAAPNVGELIAMNEGKVAVYSAIFVNSLARIWALIVRE